MLSNNLPEGFRELANWVKEGKITPVIQETYEFEDVPKAFAKVRAGRTKGKIVVHIAKE
jgi:NADPH-dependent curcumin reductase CurA